MPGFFIQKSDLLPWEKWRRGWDCTQRNLLLGRVGMRFFDTATYCIPRIYFEPSQALINKAFAATPKSRKYAKVVARR
jgi:hypothetical protein